MSSLKGPNPSGAPVIAVAATVEHPGVGPVTTVGARPFPGPMGGGGGAAAAAVAIGGDDGSDAAVAKKARRSLKDTPPAKGKKRKASANDDRVIREALQRFFGNGKGRPKENVRKIKDAFLTVFAMHEEVDAGMLARFLHLRSGDMARRLRAAKLRVAHNSEAAMKDWKFHDECATRCDSFSAEKRQDAANFWRDSSVSKPVASKKAKGGAQQKYNFHQQLFLKDAHAAYVNHKRAADPEFSCSITWFSKQRPADVKKLVVKPTGVRKDSVGAGGAGGAGGGGGGVVDAAVPLEIQQQLQQHQVHHQMQQQQMQQQVHQHLQHQLQQQQQQQQQQQVHHHHQALQQQAHHQAHMHQ